MTKDEFIFEIMKDRLAHVTKNDVMLTDVNNENSKLRTNLKKYAEFLKKMYEDIYE